MLETPGNNHDFIETRSKTPDFANSSHHSFFILVKYLNRCTLNWFMTKTKTNVKVEVAAKTWATLSVGVCRASE